MGPSRTGVSSQGASRTGASRTGAQWSATPYATALVAVAALAAPFAVAGQQAPAEDRIYARVVTAAGQVHEGFLVWDENEASWADLLNGDKEIPVRNVEDAERLGAFDPEDRERAVEFLGFRISWDEDDLGYPSRATSGVRFGHVRTLTRLDDDSALLLLRNDREVEFSGGSTDIGERVRGIVVEHPEGGRIELRWRDLDVVELVPAPAGAVTSLARNRLHGTVTDRWGNSYTGFVGWDRDEMFDDQILDGELDGREMEIPFADIASIERDGRSASRVSLRDGTELVLSGSNDVDDDNRGLQISDPELGQILLDWDDFDAFRLHPPEGPTGYETFAGAGRLRGTVVTRDGRELTGLIRWDNDEEYGWEILDGEHGDTDFDVELSKVASIEPVSRSSSRVTLRDGRTFELEGSNDVDDGNKGVFVELQDGTIELVRWEELDRVDFETPGR